VATSGRPDGPGCQHVSYAVYERSNVDSQPCGYIRRDLALSSDRRTGLANASPLVKMLNEVKGESNGSRNKNIQPR